MTKITTLTTSIFFTFILFVSCKNSDNSKISASDKTEISSTEKEVAQKDISNKIDEIIEGCKQLNVDSALKPYSDSSDFVIVNTDGSVTNFQTMRNAQTEFFKSAKSINFTTIKEDFKFLSKFLVLCTWTGRNEFELKSGERMKIEPYVGSMLFSKTDNNWKIIYAHESSATPVKVENKK